MRALKNINNKIRRYDWAENGNDLLQAARFTFNFLSDAEKWIRAYCENPGNAVLEHLLARFRGGALPKGYRNLYT